jgi:ATP-binding cassette subfamily B protein
LDQAGLVWTQLINFDKSLDLKPLLHVPGDAIEYRNNGNGMHIEFKDVIFGYPNQEPVLNGVSFVIEAGEMACIVGFNGVGKSTIIQLLARVFDPQSGTILIDGHDLRIYELKSLRAHMAFTFQDFLRYPLTGRENVAIGQIDLLDDDIAVKKAAEATGADRVLNVKASSHADGTLWEAKLSQRVPIVQGINANGPVVVTSNEPHDLSGGQWQKVALSRSFMRESNLLVLDEPSANLDPQAEYDLFYKLQESRAHRTTLFVTHRLGVVRSADKIILVENGKVLEIGTHDELVAKNGGRYRHLFQLQSEGFGKLRQDVESRSI